MAAGAGIEPDDRLVRLTPMAARGQGNHVGEVSLSYAELQQLREQRQVFADVAAFQSADLGVDLGGGTEVVLVTYASDNYFRSLRVATTAGTALPDGGERLASAVVVIGHSIWMNDFGGSSDAIGKTIRVMNVPFTIVGVAPPRFVGVDVDQLGKAAIWIPLGARALIDPKAGGDPTAPNAFRLSGFARLARGVKVGDVMGMAAPLAAHFARENSQLNSRYEIRAEPLNGMTVNDRGTKELMAAFFIVIGLIVVITCTNVSALLLGRAVARRREIGVRLSLGATRFRLVRQMLTESLVHALAGALLAMVLYIVSMKIAYATIPELIDGLQPSVTTFAYAAAFAFATTIAFGLAPALHATNADIGQVMKNSGAHAIKTFANPSHLRHHPARLQPAGAGRDIVRARGRSRQCADRRRQGSGVRCDDVGAAFSAECRRHGSRHQRFESARNARADSAPRRPDSGVKSAAVTHQGESSGSMRSAPTRPARTRCRRDRCTSRPIKFSTTGVPMVRGRPITREDDHRGSAVVVV
jgi:hypothetical protein